MAFTHEQELAINTHGTNIIVSAGAGSGKTAVLTERILRKLQKGGDISRLLVLTFTNAAALEMRVRIKKEVMKDNSLIEQANKIDSAYITTFDSFALSMVKKYHYLLGVNQNINIIDSVVVKLEKIKTLNEIFNKYYQNEDLAFKELLSKFTFKDDSALKENILKIVEGVEKIPNKEVYLSNYLAENYSVEKLTYYVEEYLKEVSKRVGLLEKTANDLYDAVSDSKLGEYINELLDFIASEHDYETYLAYFTSFKMPSLPKGSGEDVKKVKNDLKSEVDDLLKDYFVFTSKKEIYDSLATTYEYAKVLIEILKEFFTTITKYKKENNLFEFNDIAMLLLELLYNHEDVLEEMRSSFDEILLDEYQDTSDIQEAFVKLIGNNNVYMVGDIKQSIYRFRNANPYNFKEKYELYKKEINGIKIDLTKNFRSRSEVLNNINELFKHLMTNEVGDANYEIDHQMNYGNKVYDTIYEEGFNYNQEYLTYTPDETKEYSNEEIEIFITANKIKELIDSKMKIYDKDNKCVKQIDYSDIAVIIPRKKTVDLISMIFTKEGIPLNVFTDEIITNSPVISVITALFNLVDTVDTLNQQDYNYYFVSVARSFLFKLSDNFILKESFNDYKDNVIYDKAKKVKEYVQKHSVYKSFEYMLEEFNIYENLIKIGDVDKHLSVLKYIASMIENLSTSKYDFSSIAKHLETIVDEGIELKYSNNTKLNGVTLINTHKSKGLEYPVCFFIDLCSAFNRRDIKESFLFNKDFGLITPYYSNGPKDSILKTLYKNQYILEDTSEHVRLFYVALTRAREKMYFVMPNYEYLKEVTSPMEFKSYSNFIYYYYDKAIRKYVKNVNYESYVNKKYLEFASSDYEDYLVKVAPLEYDEYEYNKTILEHVKISKQVSELIDPHTSQLLKTGTRLHEILEVVDFNNLDIDVLDLSPNEKKLLAKLLTLDCFSNISSAKTYKELEFMYEDSGNNYHGIIDLLVEYDDHFEIIDYKLSEIDKEEYVKQLNEYYKYLRKITDKDIKMYLLSITKAKLKEVFVIE